jgi:hypothetical protein
MKTKSNQASYSYQLIATNGSSVQQGKIKYGGTGSLSIYLNSNVVAGNYLLLMNDGNNLFSQKIIVQ